jgi:hypothetical protein
MGVNYVMKKHIAILLFMLFSIVGATAQTTTDSSAAAPTTPLLLGKSLLQQLAGALDVSTYLNSWTPAVQSQWYSSVTKAADASHLADKVSELTDYIDAQKFQDGFSIPNIEALSMETENFGDLANVLSTLEAGLKPEAFKNDWVGKESSWQGQLKLVK